jgi:predicted permease
MPALLFRTMVTVERTGLPATGLVLAYYAATMGVWVLASVLTRVVLRRSWADAPSISIGSCFGNTVMLGLPLGSAYFGDAVTAAIAVIIAIHAPILWIVATLQQESLAGVRTQNEASRLRQVLLDLMRNPIIAGVVLGSLWRLTGLGLPSIADHLLAMIAQPAIPGSLFALGMTLTRFEVRADAHALALITVLKLVVLPLVAYVTARFALGLPAVGVDAVTVLAACPTGANAYLFADRYGHAVGAVSSAIAVGTALAAVTVTLVLVLLGAGG